MMSNMELVQSFFSGAESGKAANMSIGETDAGGHFIMGYGHAIYAYRPPDGRFKPAVFVGWVGASTSTTQHIGLMKDEDAHALQGRPGTSDVQGDPDLDVLESISSNDKDYSTNQRSFGANRGP